MSCSHKNTARGRIRTALLVLTATLARGLQPKAPTRNVALYASLRAPFESNSAANYAAATGVFPRRAPSSGFHGPRRASRQDVVREHPK